MKHKIIALLVLAIVLITSNVSCTEQSSNSPFKDGQYTGFKNVEIAHDIEKAKTQNVLVLDSFVIVSGKAVLKQFIEQASNDQNGTLIIQSYFDDGEYSGTRHLIYHDHHFYFFWGDGDLTVDKNYKHLLKLSGKQGQKYDTLYVISADKDITFDYVTNNEYSANPDKGVYEIVFTLRSYQPN